MHKTLIITVLATDRPGIVNTISEALVTHHANWVESRLVNLADKFAGLVQISVAAEHLDSLKAALLALHTADNQLHILMEDANDNSVQQGQQDLSLELIGADRPGIIDDITSTLATLKVNILELESEQREASMSSELLFFAKMSLSLPDGVTNDDVQNALEALSDQLMVDVHLST